MAHDPLYYATYRSGPLPVAYIGSGAERRGFPLGQTVQIGEADAQGIRDQDDFSFDLEPVEGLCTAEEAHPNDIGEAVALNMRLLERDGLS